MFLFFNVLFCNFCVSECHFKWKVLIGYFIRHRYINVKNCYKGCQLLNEVQLLRRNYHNALNVYRTRPKVVVGEIPLQSVTRPTSYCSNYYRIT